MDLISLGLGVGTIALVPLGAITKRAYAVSAQVTKLERDFAAHTAADAVSFKNIETTLLDLKNEQRDQTQKLDRLIERFL